MLFKFPGTPPDEAPSRIWFGGLSSLGMSMDGDVLALGVASLK